jgi:hypothetical protein
VVVTVVVAKFPPRTRRMPIRASMATTIRVVAVVGTADMAGMDPGRTTLVRDLAREAPGTAG